MSMKDDFILVHENSIPTELCRGILQHFNYMVEQGYFRTSQAEGAPLGRRKDICMHFPEVELAKRNNPNDKVENPNNNYLRSDELPGHWVRDYFENIESLVNFYQTENLIPGPTVCTGFKVHQVNQGEGYYDFHIENDNYLTATRVLTFMTYIEKPESGGETEFLFQSKRVEPEVGTTLIWPAYFTHPHRGNPVISGRKTYITGWYLFK